MHVKTTVYYLPCTLFLFYMYTWSQTNSCTRMHAFCQVTCMYTSWLHAVISASLLVGEINTIQKVEWMGGKDGQVAGRETSMYQRYGGEWGRVHSRKLGLFRKKPVESRTCYGWSSSELMQELGGLGWSREAWRRAEKKRY